MTDSIDDRRALSPVVGDTLMVAIAVVIGALLATMAFGMADRLGDSAPAVVNAESIEVSLQGNDTDHTLEFVHQGGNSVPGDALVAAVGDGSAAETIHLDGSSADALADGTWSAGERLRLDIEESSVCDGGGDSASVRLTYEESGGDRSFTVSERTVPVERGEFLNRGDTVVPTADFTANVKFLGTGWSSPSYDAPVNVSVRVNGTEVKAWEMVRDSNTTVGAYGISRRDAGSTVSVVTWGHHPADG